MQQGRWISYIFLYNNDLRSENIGFIKVQRITYQKDEKARLQIGLKLQLDRDGLFDIFLIKDQSAYYIDQFEIKKYENDTITKRIELPWRNTLENDYDISDYDGIFLKGERTALGTWHNNDVRPSEIELVYKNQSIAEASATATMAYDVPQRLVTENKLNNDIDKIPLLNYSSDGNYVDECERMLDRYPEIEGFPKGVYKRCVKIMPKDIGLLPMENWGLGVNSFLSHGYYTYKYIMMGIVEYNGKDVYVIGIPGIYTNKEKYLANMFGFKVFIPLDDSETNTGKFGYWLSEIIRP